MSNTPPTIADFKLYFRPGREFIYGSGLDMVQDADIARGLSDAGIVFNASLWDASTVVLETLTESDVAYITLAAHKMVYAVQFMSGGLSAVARGKGTRSSPYSFPVASGVGQANVSYQVPPERVRESAVLLDLWMTIFGQSYLSMLDTRLTGRVFVVAGTIPVGAFDNTPPNIDPGPPV